MSAGVKIAGLDRVVSKYFAGELKYEHALEAAVKISLNVVKKHARAILKDRVYDAPGRHAWERELSGRLYKSFRSVLMDAGGGRASGVVENTASEAPWLEDGTQSHLIEPVEAKALHWVSGHGDVFSGGHRVSGIEGIHFMREALILAEPEIRRVFRAVFADPDLSPGQVEFSIGSTLLDDEDDIGGTY